MYFECILPSPHHCLTQLECPCMLCPTVLCVCVRSRYDSNSGGEREIQRTMLELLNQLDGFDSRGDVKVIMATNRIETLDPALIRPGHWPIPV